MTPSEFIDKAYKAAVESGHIFPEFAVCEAALESAWGKSKLCVEANNLFGQKRGKENYPEMSIRTREYVGDGKWVTIPARWPKFPDWKTSFAERMNLLRRNPVYGEALKATTGVDFVKSVSKYWATDPLRADKVLSIYRKHFNLRDKSIEV
jgi:flagellum-specific peptidoglycan hydrolase FlgJ